MAQDTNLKPASRWQARFFTIWGGQAVSMLGSQLVQFALIWWLTKTTGSATVLTTASLVGLLPQVFLMPLAGALVDRWNRRRVMIVADTLIASLTLLLAALFWSGQVQIWHIYVLMFLRSALGGFHWAAMQPTTTLMVPAEHLARVQGLNQVLQGALGIISAPAGALLLELLPMQGVLGVDVVTALVAVAPLLFIAIPQNASQANGDGARTSVWQDFVQGLRYVASWPGLIIIGLMATLINFLLTPAFALMPLLVTRHFGGTAIDLAWTESLFGIGMIAGGLTLGVWGGFKNRILTTLIGLLGIGVGSLALGFTPASAFPLALGIMFWMGFVNPITNGPLMAAVQAVVEPEMQGRVFTLIGSFASAISPLGLIIAGPIADSFGVQSWMIVGGVVTLLMGISGYFIPAVINFEKGRHKPGTPDPAVNLAPITNEATD